MGDNSEDLFPRQSNVRCRFAPMSPGADLLWSCRNTGVKNDEFAAISQLGEPERVRGIKKAHLIKPNLQAPPPQSPFPHAHTSKICGELMCFFSESLWRQLRARPLKTEESLYHSQSVALSFILNKDDHLGICWAHPMLGRQVINGKFRIGFPWSLLQAVTLICRL